MKLLPVLCVLALGISGTYARCAEGWTYHEGICYWLSSDKLSWMDAGTMCRALKSRLVEMDEQDKNNHVAREISRNGGGSFWIGLTDVESEGHWKWTNTRRKASYTLTNWDRSEPNGREKENCATTDSDGQWNDAPCSNSNKYVCQTYAS